MNKQGTIQRTLMAMAIASAVGFSATALAVGEVEPNGVFTSPQKLEVGAGGGSITVNGEIKNASSVLPDVDFYSFEARKDDVVTLDIDGASGTLNTKLYLFNPDGMRVADNDNTDPADDGSTPVPGLTATRDAQIKNFPIDKSGTWIVAVTAWPATLDHQGKLTLSMAASAGTYNLVLSGLKPPMDVVHIQVKPGQSGRDRPINPDAKGTIQVALLSNRDNGFDPFDIEEASLGFGRTGNEASFTRCHKDGHDLNGDGKRDRICHFDLGKTEFTRSDTLGVLKGKRNGGKPFEGRGDLKIDSVDDL